MVGRGSPTSLSCRQGAKQKSSPSSLRPERQRQSFWSSGRSVYTDRCALIHPTPQIRPPHKPRQQIHIEQEAAGSACTGAAPLFSISSSGTVRGGQQGPRGRGDEQPPQQGRYALVSKASRSSSGDTPASLSPTPGTTPPGPEDPPTGALSPRPRRRGPAPLPRTMGVTGRRWIGSPGRGGSCWERPGLG